MKNIVLAFAAMFFLLPVLRAADTFPFGASIVVQGVVQDLGTSQDFSFQVAYVNDPGNWGAYAFVADTIFLYEDGTITVWVVEAQSDVTFNSATLSGIVSPSAPQPGTFGVIVSKNGALPEMEGLPPDFAQKMKRYFQFRNKSVRLQNPFEPTKSNEFQQVADLVTPKLAAGTYSFNFVGTYSTSSSFDGVGLDINVNGIGHVVGNVGIAQDLGRFYGNPVFPDYVPLIREASPGIGNVPVMASGMFVIPTGIKEVSVRFAKTNSASETGILTSGVLTWERVY